MTQQPDAKPVFRIGKLHAQGGPTSPSTVMGHLTRARHTPNADPKRLDDNVYLIGSADIDLDAAIAAMHKKEGVQPRSNAVIANDFILTISPNFFRPDDPSRAGYWESEKEAILRDEAVKFVEEHFGGLTRVLVLHLDEATPHVQGVMVPLLPKKGGGMRLCAKDFFDPDRLRYLQQAWEGRLTPHGVGPRTQMSKVAHVDLKTYYATVHQIQVLDLSVDLRPLDPPKPEPAESEKDYRYRLETWKSGEQARLRERLTPLWASAIYGRVSARANRRANILQVRLNKSSAKLEEALTMLKAYIPPSGTEVEEMLGRSLADGEAVLDGVMRLGQLGRADAIRLIAERIGPEQAANAVREKTLKALIVAKPAPPIRMSFELNESGTESSAQGPVEPPRHYSDNYVEDDTSGLRL